MMTLYVNTVNLRSKGRARKGSPLLRDIENYVVRNKNRLTDTGKNVLNATS